MRKIDRELDRILALLRARIRERGFTQMEVQEVLGWGRSYISQLLTGQKTLRLEQILQILNVINIDPADFWGEIYQFGKSGETPPPGRRSPHAAPSLPDAQDGSTQPADLRSLKRLLDGVVSVLTQKNLITARELDDATRRFRQDAPAPAHSTQA